MKRLPTIVIAMSLLTFAVVAFAEEKEGEKAPELKPQTVCPVMGGKINKQIHVDYQGQRIYFCCKGCPAAFETDPEKYMKKLDEASVGAAKKDTPQVHKKHKDSL